MTQEKNEKKIFSTSSMRLLFGTNHPVSVNSTDDNDSFWSRLQVIPFTQTISAEAKDPHLVQKLLDERDDIVSYCIQRMPEIIERGYKLSPCQAAEDLKNEWRYGIPDDDSLESFCDTFLEITGNKEDIVLATHIYTPYKEYCKTLGMKPLCDEKIKEWFNSHGGSCERKRLPGIKNAQSVILGIRLRKEYRELAHEDVSDEDINEVYDE
jgi:phage/plasmid-associated DNA primase